MSLGLSHLASAPRRLAHVVVRRSRWSRAELAGFVRRLAYFLAVWPLLLTVHEAGHTVAAWQQGRTVREVTVGVGPVLWRGTHHDTDLVLRLVPVVGLTRIADQPSTVAARDGDAWSAWRHEAVPIAAGVLATLTLALGMTGAVALWERSTRRRWVWGRIVVADAIVLTVFNFLPVPPLDGGRAVLGAVAAFRGAPLSGDALFWVHIGGLALAVVPMTLWTRWTARIDRAALSWRTPRPTE